MPLLPVNTKGSGVDVSNGDLAAALATLSADAPVVVLIHGFRFDPSLQKSNPHDHILALEPDKSGWKAISWPRHLGFGRSKDEGLCIGFGWPACGSIWAAYGAAAEAGIALAGLLAAIRSLSPGRRIDIMAHSLGARVLLCGLPLIEAGSIGRAILLAGAEFGTNARAALASPAGQTAQIINITSRENDLFDAMFETLIRAPSRGDRCLGHGLADDPCNWLDLQVDQSETLTALAGLGFRIAPPRLRICHWSAYLRPGLFRLYRALLRDPTALSLDHLRAALPVIPEPRWSRLLAWPAVRLPLPFAGKSPS